MPRANSFILQFTLLLMTASTACLAAGDSSNEARKCDDADVKAGYECLLRFEPDQAILKFCRPLNQAIAAQDLSRASRYMRLIAFAFRLDENDEAAKTAALQAVALDPSSDYARLDAADYLFRAGQWQRSLEIIEGLKKSKDRKVALRASIHESMRTMSMSKALADIQKEPEEIRLDPKILSLNASLYLLNEQTEYAEPVLKQVSRVCPSPYMSKIFEGRAALAAKKFDEARKSFELAGQIVPKDPLWNTELGLLALKQNNIKVAREHLAQALNCRRLSSQAYVNWAVVEAYFGTVDEARRCLDFIAKRRPNGADVVLSRGLVEEKAGKIDLAQSYFKKVIELNPYNSSAYLHLLNIARDKKESAELFALIDQWLKTCPLSLTGQFECGRALVQEGHLEEGVEHLNTAERYMIERASLKRKFTQQMYLSLLAARSTALQELGSENEKQALADAFAFNQRKPAPAKAGGLFVRPTKFPESIMSSAKSLKDDKAEKNRLAHNAAAREALLADVLYENKRLAEAAQRYRKAIELEPENILWHSCLLKVLIDKRDFAEAAKEDIYVAQHMVNHIPDLFKK